MISDVNSTLNTKSETTGQLAIDRYHYGDVRDDGYVFAFYDPKGAPHWYSPRAFLRRRIDTNLRKIKARAESKNIPFNLTTDYLVSIFPADSICPALGIEMAFGGKERGRTGSTNNSPALDRIVPETGYVIGNVIWVSTLANCIKHNASVDQLFSVAQFYQRLLHNPSLFVPGHTIH